MKSDRWRKESNNKRELVGDRAQREWLILERIQKGSQIAIESFITLSSQSFY